jgi:membrane protein
VQVAVATRVTDRLRRLPDRLRTALGDRMPPVLREPASIASATVRGAVQDRITGLAAELAFWVLLSLPPLLLVAASAAGFLGDRVGADVRTGLIERIGEIALQVFNRSTVDTILTPTLNSLLESESASVLSLSFLIAIYSASRVLRVAVLAISIAYDLQDVRPTYMARVLGFALTIAGLLLGLVLIPLIVAGPRLGEIAEERLGVDLLLGELWRVLYWPASFVVLALLLALLYHFAAPWHTPFRRELPGAVLATVLGLVLTVALRAYTQFAFGGDAIYAPLAAPLAFLLWVWLQGIALLLGAELNAEIERARPTSGHDPGHVSGVQKLGRRAVVGARDAVAARAAERAS